MNWDLMNGLAGAGEPIAYVIGFGLVMAVGWALSKGKYSE